MANVNPQTKFGANRPRTGRDLVGRDRVLCVLSIWRPSPSWILPNVEFCNGVTLIRPMTIGLPNLTHKILHWRPRYGDKQY